MPTTELRRCRLRCTKFKLNAEQLSDFDCKSFKSGKFNTFKQSGSCRDEALTLSKFFIQGPFSISNHDLS